MTPRRLPLLLTAALSLSGCGLFTPPPASAPNTPGTPDAKPDVKILGLLEVRVEGIGDGGTPTATAQFVRPPSDTLSAQSSVVVPDTGIVFERTRVAFVDDDVTNTRYVSTLVDIRNTTAKAFSNLTLYATSVPNVSIGGTAIKNMVDGRGVAITDPKIAQNMLPTHGMRIEGRNIVVSDANADFQAFTPDEAADVQTQAAKLTPPVVGDVLEYGYVARNFTGGRAIAAGTNGACNVDACKGSLTMGYKFPKVTPRNANPWGFTSYFVVADDPGARVAVSVEEQSAPNAAVTRANALGPTTNLAVIGTNTATTVAQSRVTWLCTLRTAGSKTQPLKFLGFAPDSHACNGKWDASNWNELYWR